MRQHHGAHPRMGATDVCPFVPVAGVTMEDCAAIAREVGRAGRPRAGHPGLPLRGGGDAARAAEPGRHPQRRVRGAGARSSPTRTWTPDFGPAGFNARAGATVIGAREFLIAYNVTLNTRDKALATDIAFELREKGRVAARDATRPTTRKGEDPHLPEDAYPVRQLRLRRRDLRRDGSPLPRGRTATTWTSSCGQRRGPAATSVGQKGLPGGRVQATARRSAGTSTSTSGRRSRST